MTDDKVPFFERDITWLSFNERVLQEAENKDNPLLERARFLGIFSSNMDEFFRVRVAALKRQRIIKNSPKIDDVLEKIDAKAKKLQNRFEIDLARTLQEFRKENVYIIDHKTLSESQSVFVKKFFREKVQRFITPIMLNQKKATLQLSDKTKYMFVQLINDQQNQKEFSIIQIPDDLNRFVVLPTENNLQYVIFLDDVIRHCFSEIFQILEYTHFKGYAFKFSSDAALEYDGDFSKSFVEKLRASLENRDKGATLRFVYDEKMPKTVLNILLQKLEMKKETTLISGGKYHNMKDLINVPLKMKHLEFQPIRKVKHKAIENAFSMFEAISAKDILLHFPYHSFNSIIRLLREAAIDPKVEKIKIIIYRLAEFSAVTGSLINALKNGKKVTIVIELKARFDEKANIVWTELFKKEGATVIFTPEYIKVHAKLIYISRRENGKLTRYCNVSTGNFNEETASVYADLSLLTKKNKISKEVRMVFNLLENNFIKTQFENFLVSPYNSKDIFIKKIEREIKRAQQGKKGKILLKVNSLENKEIIRALYQASQQGVKIDIIVRGICCLIPGVKGLSENINIRSIVGRYLEHARIFVFGAENPEVYISSADLMTRNLTLRVEVICPIYDEDLKKQLIEIIELQLHDNVKARIIDSRLSNTFYKGGKERINSQEKIIEILST